MGNKSKCSGEPQKKKWDERRDLAKARQPKSWTSWGGLSSPSPSKFGIRLLASPAPVVHKLVINERAQPWQKHAAKLKKRADARRAVA